MKEKSFNEKTCVVCSQKVRESLVILSSFICLPCESMLLRTQIGSPDYLSAVEGVKKIWQKSGVKIVDGQ